MQSVNLSGYGLTDKLDEPLQWVFPSGTVLGPKQRLLIWADEDGAQGLVLNRPIDADVDAVLPGWEEHASHPAKVFQGGPVQLDSALGLVAVPGDTPEPTGVRRLFGSVALVDLDTPPVLVVHNDLSHLPVELRTGLPEAQPY